MAQQSDSKASEPGIKPTTEPTANSSTADAPDKDASIEMAAGYGTRSRNRTGSSRPNYAEDKDYDVEMYDYDHDKAHGESKKSARQVNAANAGESARGTPGSRKASGDDARSGPSQNGSKEQTPAGGTGTPHGAQTSSSATHPSRKRKAATAAQQANSNAASVSTRRAGTTAQNSAASSWPETNILTFTNSRARPQNGQLVADDGTVLEANDHVYLVCEPPGEPYYLGRIMEFLHPENDSSRPVDAVRINWFYRPRDIGRKVHDTRVVFATMHSDISPLTALRGKCQIKHRVEIANMDEYRRTPDSFWFEKLYDRYIQKNYDLIPTSSIVNVPEKVKKVLDERWRFVLVEQGRGKELTSAVKLCKRCSGYCASNDSVDCAVCQNTYHMNCVRPPLLKKPSRGFAWSCAACSRAQERKLEARHTPNLNDPHGDADEDEPLEEEDDAQGADTGRSSPADDNDESHHHGTAEQIYNASLWPWRYLGMHCKPEDALDYDDRIYPRASTRIGPRHQAPVGPWPGRPVHYVKPPEKKKGKKDTKAVEEAQAAELYPDGKRPKWIQDTPPGYIARGEDPIDPADPNATSTLMWKPPTSEDTARRVDEFMTEAKHLGPGLGLPERSTNLQDVILESLLRNDYDVDKAMKAVLKTDKEKFKEPNPTPQEQKKFEEAVGKYGSELHLVMKHVKTMTPGQVTRYYYTWKKTGRGQAVWSNYSGRKGKKEAKRAEKTATKMTDDVADADDDSAFDSGKAVEKKRAFMCQFCSNTTSRRWRRAPNAPPGLVNENGVKATSKDKGGQYIVALCTRCAELWRRYAIRWEDLDEISKKVSQAGGKAWKRKQDEEVLKELQAANDRGLLTPDRPGTPLNGAAGSGQEPPRKKIKGIDKDVDSDGRSGSGLGGAKKKDKTSEAPAMPELPKPRTLPCAVCNQVEPMEDHVSCRECRLSVHRTCYGIVENRGAGKWTCDMCVNDKSPQVSTNYKCVLCPVEHTEHELVEQPKLTHHKKKMSEKDRERERLEVLQARKALDLYRKKQEDLNRPLNPREALKRTADNNWVHVTCAVFTTEVKFGNAKAMEPIEGIPSIPRSKYEEICDGCNRNVGPCVSCPTCRTSYHIECARKFGHRLYFDMVATKASRKDQAHIVTFSGASGTMSPFISCNDEIYKGFRVQMHDEDDTGLTALQLYVQNYKQADLTLTGTVRKANLMTMAAKMSGTAMQAGFRRLSTTNPLPNGGAAQPRNGDPADPASDALRPGEKVCICCGIDVSPRWWQIDNSGGSAQSPFHTLFGKMGEEAKKFVSQRNYQCHKCHSARMPMKPPSPKPRGLGSSWSSLEPSRPHPSEPGIAAVAASVTASASALRSPERNLPADHRDGRQPPHSWPQPPSIHSVVQQPVQPPQPLPHTNGSRPTPGPHAFSPPSAHSSVAVPPSIPPPVQAPPAVPYNEWGSRPRSQHGSPPRHPNGGPPLSGLSSLRPPSMPGPPPSGPPPLSHQQGHGHGHQSYINGMPPSPRRASGPAPPSPYAAPYHTGPIHGAPPPPPQSHGPSHGGAHGLSNGVPPPRHDAYPPGPPPQRQPFPGPHGSPLGSRVGLPQSHESPGSIGPNTPRNESESRPTSGASANPSLRNLLS